jgi:hypothetical protein
LAIHAGLGRLSMAKAAAEAQLMDAHIDPFRTLAWRFERARALREQQRRAARCDDIWVRRALSWLRAPRRQQPWHSAIAAAHALYEANSFPRWSVEAWLLTEEPTPVVAVACSLPVEVVHAFAHLFFDISAGLHAPSWLCLRVLPRRCSVVGIPPGDTASLLKLVALRGGKLALKQTLRVLAEPRRTSRPRTGQELDEALSDLSCRFALFLHTLPASAFRQPALSIFLRVAQALAELHRSVDAASQPGPLDLVRREVQEVLLPPMGAGQASPTTVDDLALRLGQLEDIVERLESLQFARAA